MLYASWYARPVRQVRLPEDFPADLVQVLRAADVMGRRWQRGWIVDRLAVDGRVIARRKGAVRMGDRVDYVGATRPGILPAVGAEIVMTGRRDRIDADRAWWRAANAAWRFGRGEPGLVRLYWSVHVDQLPAFVERLTELLADERRPWMAKCAVDPAVHARADATVLYLSGDLARERAEGFARLADILASAMHPAVPPLTMRVRPGLGAAADPDGSSSFGLHRCEQIVAAAEGSPAPTVDVVVDRLESAGLSLRRPFAMAGEPALPWER